MNFDIARSIQIYMGSIYMLHLQEFIIRFPFDNNMRILGRMQYGPNAVHVPKGMYECDVAQPIILVDSKYLVRWVWSNRPAHGSYLSINDIDSPEQERVSEEGSGRLATVIRKSWPAVESKLNTRDLVNADFVIKNMKQNMVILAYTHSVDNRPVKSQIFKEKEIIKLDV